MIVHSNRVRPSLMGADTSTLSSYVIGWANHPVTLSVVRISQQISDDIRASGSKLFETSLMPFYRMAPVPHFNVVDPDIIEPYVLAWITSARASGETFSAQGAYDAMVNARFEADRSQEVANAMLRAYKSGNLVAPEVLNPSKADQGLLDQILEFPIKTTKSVLTATTKALSSAESLAQWLPVIALVGAAGVGLLVVWPYLQAARKPGQVARRIA